MRRFITGAAALLAALVIVAACSAPGATVSGAIGAEARPVSGVTHVHLDGGGSLIVTQGGAEALTIEAAADLLPWLATDVRDGRLTIERRDWWGWLNAFRPARPITYRLTVKQLNAVGLSGAGAMRASAIRTDRLTLDLSGAGSATIDDLTADELGVTIAGAGRFTGSGAVARQQVSISGAGHYDGAGLQAEAATVTMSGAGLATVRASEALNVEISGASNVTYLGAPKAIALRVSGSGSVRPGQE
jgi:hypothetical protein